MRTFSEKKVVDEIKINIFFFENRAVYEIMLRIIVELGRPQTTAWRMRIACSITKAKKTHTGCLMLIAFPLQERLNESSSLLRFAYFVLFHMVLKQCACMLNTASGQ